MPAMTGKQFRFNPMLHELSIPVRTDFGTVFPADGTVKDPIPGYLKGEIDLPSYLTDEKYLKGLRLGRIYQHERAAGMAGANQYRYGFRFLYNPTSIDTTASRNNSVISDPSNPVAAVVSGINQNFQVISFSLLLNRIPDLTAGSYGNRYPIRLSQEDVAGLQQKGTHWDLEYLYRVCNGMFNLADRGRTSDIGMIIPSNATLVLGKGKSFFGFVEGVSYNDVLFTPRMVPALTMVQIMFRRHVDMTPDTPGSDDFGDNLGGGGGGGAAAQARRVVFQTSSMESQANTAISPIKAAENAVALHATGEGGTIDMDMLTKALDVFPGLIDGLGILGEKIMESINASGNYPSAGSGSGSSSGSTGSSGDSVAIPTGGGALTGAQVEQLVKNAGFPADTTNLMTKIAWEESKWIPTAHNPRPPDNSYGLWQINMIGQMGVARRKEYGISSNEMLFNPEVNAKAAYAIYKSQGLSAWTTLAAARKSNKTW